MSKILIIEDDADLLEGLSFALSTEGYYIDEAATICEAREKIAAGNYDLLLLDCNLPDGSGFELCREISPFCEMSIFMLTARDTELDEIKALELGADDYMSKPFSVGVLKARIKKLLSKGVEPNWLNSNHIRVDQKECRVYKGEEALTMGKIEYKLLLYLMDHRNQVLSKEQILEHIWDQEGKFVDENIVSVNIRRLRRKVEINPDKPECIKTVHGLGYIWKES